MHAKHRYAPARNLRSPLTSSPLARSTTITASTSAAAGSFTIPASRTGCAADRWKSFLSSVSRAAAASGFDTTRLGSIAAKSWSVHDLVWGNSDIGC
jgi:hypothetical protein